MSESITVQTVVQESRIEVPAPPGFSNGQRVAITIQPVTDPSAAPLSEAVTRAFGILSQEEGEDLDRYLEESRQQQVLEEKEEDL